MSKVLDVQTAASTFQNLAEKLVALLQKPSATSSPALPAALEALGTLGHVAPAVFGPHAAAMADFVLDELLETPLDDCLSGDLCPAAPCSLPLVSTLPIHILLLEHAD